MIHAESDHNFSIWSDAICLVLNSNKEAIEEGKDAYLNEETLKSSIVHHFCSSDHF